ncbi:glycosyltransferase family 2 protein [Epilithonimonas sp.]|uniref:glycosyltransferase family 2 protein n=1 Tax=Epilithonimonas sp. TaxID=2894511 RepID=UPI0035B262F6
MKKISIIIPLYNAKNYIARCLDSVKAQTYRDFEVIVINDKSKDNSWTVLNNYVTENLDIDFKIIDNEVNLGLSKTRNKGMDLAAGDYILFMDNDDTLANEYSLEYFIEMTENDPDIVLGKTRFLLNDVPKESNYHTLKNKKETYSGNEILDGFFSGEWAVTAWNKLYKTDFLKKNHLKFLDDLLHEDELWAFETAVAAKKINFLEQETYVYYSLSNPNSMTATVGLKNIEHYLITLTKKLELSREKELYSKSEQTKKYLKNFTNFTILNNVCKMNFAIFKSFYMRIRKEFAKNFPEKDLFSLNALLAYYLYKMKFDKEFFLYGKFPKYINPLLKI